MDDEQVASFASITGAAPERARQYLEMADKDLQRAIDLFFSMGGVDLAGTAPVPQEPPPVPQSTRPRPQGEVIQIDSDEEADMEPQAVAASRGDTHLSTNPSFGGVVEDDAAMARRLQEEMYGGADSGEGAAAMGAGNTDSEGYRAPIARTRETLVGPGSYEMADEDDMQAAVMEQMRRRQRRGQSRPGIFNQQSGPGSIWNESTGDSERQARLSQATGGASERSSKSTMLAEMFRPPFELMSRLSWDDGRAKGKEELKWILVNVQDPSIFDCQLLNRDLWKHEGIKETIKENFIFMQYSKDDPRGNQYMQYYFQERDVDSAYPHIAIVDPRTGEQVKVWSGPPAPKPMDFLMQLHEFLDRYSLNVAARNPVAKRKPEPKKETQVERMTEDEQLEMALQQSLAGSAATKDFDPDELTRSIGELGETSGNDSEMVDAEQAESNGRLTQASALPFASISSQNPHEEPPIGSGSTRIQLRHPSGRVVRRFALADTVRRIYEWLKAKSLDSPEITEGKEFDLIFMGQNLIDSLDETIERVGLKNATINLELIAPTDD